MKYEILETPFEFPGYEKAVSAQAIKYYNWRMSTKEERIAYLSSYINNSGYKIELDYTIESFQNLWGWFEGVINKNNMPIDWFKECDKVMSNSCEEKTDIDSETIGIIMDMGMYVGETLVKNFPSHVQWTIITKPGYISSKRPIIKGEKEHDIFDPELVISNLATKYVKYNNERNLLYYYCIAWIMSKIDGEYYKKIYCNKQIPYEMPECPYYHNIEASMNKRRCEQYAKWFMDTRYERIKYLDNYLKSCGENISLDYTPESLIYLFKWCMPKIYFVQRAEEDYQKILDHEGFNRNEYRNEFLPFETEIILKDMAIYLGEMMIKNYPYKLYWEFKEKGDALYTRNRMVVNGFPGIFTYRDPLRLIDKEARSSAFAKLHGDIFELYQGNVRHTN